MKISLNWLKAYIKTNLNAEQISRTLTQIGLEVEGFEKAESIRGGLAGLVVGEVLVFYLMLNQMDPLPVLGGHFNAGFIALAANFVVFVLVSAVTKNGKTRLV